MVLFGGDCMTERINIKDNKVISGNHIINLCLLSMNLTVFQSSNTVI
jgi:hypothetical protein